MATRFIFLFFIFIFLFSTPVAAAKKRLWASTPIVASGGTPAVSAKLTGWKQYLNINFRGVAATNGFTYELTFNGNNMEQGVYGTVKPTEGNVTRSLFLGTCSHGACTAFKNINSLRLTVSYTLKSGQSIVKKYKVKY